MFGRQRTPAGKNRELLFRRRLAGTDTVAEISANGILQGPAQAC